MLHLTTDYKITNKDLKDLTPLQYFALLIISEKIFEWKKESKPMVVL